MRPRRGAGAGLADLAPRRGGTPAARSLPKRTGRAPGAPRGGEQDRIGRRVAVEDRRRRRAPAPRRSPPSRGRCRATSRKAARCTASTVVISATCGRASRASGAISPGAFMPISMTAKSRSAGIRASVSGTPQWLLKLFSAACDAALRAERRAQHLLAAGLADRAGDRDDAGPRSAPARRAPSARSAVEHVRHDEQRRVRRHALRPPRRPAPRRRRCASASATKSCPSRAGGQRDEEVARRERAGVDRDAGRRPSRRRARAAGRPRPPRRASRAASTSAHAPSPSSAATATLACSRSSKGRMSWPTIWPVSWPLPAISSASPGCSASTAVRIASARSPISVASGAPARTAARIAAGSSVRGLSSVTIDDVRRRGRRRAHQRPLAAVAVAAGAEDDDEPPHDVRAQRGQRRGQRVGRVGVVDEDRGAVRPRRRPLHAAAHGAQRRQRADAPPPGRCPSRWRGRPRPARCAPGSRRSARAAPCGVLPVPGEEQLLPGGVEALADQRAARSPRRGRR